MDKFMKAAIKEERKGVLKGDGGPFGAVIVKDNKIIARGHNMVLKTKDPTAHAEIVTIRKACKKLKSFHISDCILYTSCEPCPMCLAAIYWANIKKVYFGCNRQDAEDIGFSDKMIYDEFKNEVKVAVELVNIDREFCLKGFEYWKNKSNKTMY